MRKLIAASTLIGALLLYLLSEASGNSDLFSSNLNMLLMATGVLGLFLLGVVSFQFMQLRRKMREQVFGAVLAYRLALFFTLIAIVPGILVYGVSVQFLSKSIESWFDVRVEKALDAGLNLGRGALENGLKDLSKKGQFIALLLAEQEPGQHVPTLNRLISEGAAQEVALFGVDGRLLAFASSERRLAPDFPTEDVLHEVRTQGIYSVVDALPDNRLVLKVLVPVNSAHADSSRILQFIQMVPRQLSEDAEMVQGVYSDYQGLSISRLGLKRMYGLALTLFLLIVLLGVVSVAIILSNRLSAPLAALAEGTRAVAQGDFSRQHEVQSSDELGVLTGLFNQMTKQLSDARGVSEQQQRQAEDAKRYLESVLARLSSGVLVVDAEHRIRSVNESASEILGVDMLEMQGQPLHEVAVVHWLLRPFIAVVEQAFDEVPNAEWQRQIERMSKNGVQNLLVRGTRLSSAEEAITGEEGYVVVFDDITHLLRAERQAAWGEVARRLAHEIKNPLTPIQLSAERLQHKLSDKLDEKDAGLLRRATQTIVSQVTAMKNMVSDFADYARAPALKLVELDMHKLLREVLGLYEGNRIPVVVRLEASLTRLNGDATRLRQVIHNLLQNAQDALQQTEGARIELSTANHENWLMLVVQDNGSGFPKNLLDRAFEPYVTTKPKGTGLGLAIVKKIVEEHGGHIAIANVETGGARIVVSLPLLTGAA